MPAVNRRDFLEGLLTKPKSTESKYDIYQDEIFLKYSNKEAPLKLSKHRSGLSQYSGTWGEKQKIHFLRRLMFGVKPSDVAALGSMTMSQAVDTFLNTPPPTPAPPVNYYENIYADPTGIPLGSTWVNAAYGDGTVDYYRRISTKAWWMNNIHTQGFSIMEKMILFWHNNFVVESNNAGDARMFYKYLNLLRTHALGNYKDFVKAVTKEPMMLFYLNGHYNIKNSPDENYARELQELFTVGKGTGLWNEDDVKAAAKVLTGFRVDINTLTSSFNPAFHETANKVFSPFYNNTVITGQAGAAGENELDDLLNMIFLQNQIVAKFICRKIYRFFVYYNIDATTESVIITGLANTFIANNWDIKPVLSQLFKSDHFFDSLSMDCFIRTPMDYFMGMMRSLDIQFPTSANLEDQYKAYYQVASLSSICGMDPGDPPNVAGWTAYYQSPHYHQMWINSDTLPKRMKNTDALFTTNGIYVSATAKIKCDVLAFAQTLSDPSDPVAIIDDCVKYLLAIGLSTSLKDSFKTLLLDGSGLNSSWTTAWNNYMANPGNTTLSGIVSNRLRDMLTKLLRMAEHHLC
ncbi:MAG: DUF1800 domain-containing protein [Bacteroidetes bacterium]|nr:DUF1800 domain-containing protein [Bacteroidota bacterium]